MQATFTSDRLDSPRDAPASPDSLRSPAHLRAHVTCAATALLFFLADLVLPRGATPAIGYCLVLFLSRATNRRSTLLAVAAACTVLTWLGYFLEPAGAPPWMSIFERAMVTGVLWLTLLLIRHRMDADDILAERARSLRDAIRELNRSNAELQNFASVVSHDIRGPLNSVSLLIGLLADRPAIHADHESDQCIASIAAEIVHINSMIQRLLAYGRVGAADLILADCDCQRILDTVRLALGAQCRAADARITNEPLPTLRADPTLLAELLQNLIENAIKYRGPFRPTVHVSADPTPGGWLFSVRDNGVGIRPQNCPHVFDPFFRAPDARHLPGTGLGLATCKRILQRHGGHISVDSTPGQGTTFTFLIPTATTPSMPHAGV